MSLGTWTARSTKYQVFLNLSNVLMLIVSTLLIFFSGILIHFYHLTKLDFWSWYFYACPMCMLALGLYTFAVSVYGFLISKKESRKLLSLVAIFFSIAFLVQLFSIFTAIGVNNTIRQTINIPKLLIQENMGQYEKDYTIKNNWDSMQRNLRCCGDLNHETGYMSWSFFLNEDVPDSCCHKESEGCGRGKLNIKYQNQPEFGIWKVGCMEILQTKLRDEVTRLMMVYSGVGVLLAIVELITVVLACSYIAQITRRMKKNDMRTKAVNENFDVDDSSSLTLDFNLKETNF